MVVGNVGEVVVVAVVVVANLDGWEAVVVVAAAVAVDLLVECQILRHRN